jgi:putative oxidoreductase
MGAPVGVAIIRVALGLLMAAYGLAKASPRLGFGGLRGTAEEFARDGLRGGLVPAVIAAAAQLGGGVLLAAGLLTPLAAMAEAGVMTVAAVTRAHSGFWARGGGCEYPALLAVLSVAFIWSGGGRVSLDDAIGWHAPGSGFALGATLLSIAAAALTVAILRDHAPSPRADGGAVDPGKRLGPGVSRLCRTGSSQLSWGPCRDGIPEPRTGSVTRHWTYSSSTDTTASPLHRSLSGPA